MHVAVVIVGLAACVALTRANSTGAIPQQEERRREDALAYELPKEMEDVSTLTSSEVTQNTNDILALARQHAIQVIVEKMLFALGPDFLEENHGAPNNQTHPTVSTPLNITTDPCPDIYTKCSSEVFFSSCETPPNTNHDLWNHRFNLFFDLPEDLLAHDRLLKATLRIYKNLTLPLDVPITLVVEMYYYKKSLTKRRDWSNLFNFTDVASDYIGWVTFDLTELIRKLKPKKNHGFFIKVRDNNGILWNAPELLIPMDCSDANKSVVPMPFGIKTDQPEQRYPSLTIHTGMENRYFSGMDDEEYVSISDSNKEDKIYIRNYTGHKFHSPKNSKYDEKHRSEGRLNEEDDHFDSIVDEDIPQQEHKQSKSHSHHQQPPPASDEAIGNLVYKNPLPTDEPTPISSLNSKYHMSLSKESNMFKTPNERQQPGKKRSRSRRRHQHQHHAIIPAIQTSYLQGGLEYVDHHSIRS